MPSTLGFYITGHSLGGALAQIASAALSRDNLAACYTFGSPRVGTAGFDEQVKCPHYRVINNCPGSSTNVLPRLSPQWRPASLDPQNIVCTSPRQIGQLSLQYCRNSLVTLRTRELLINDDHMIWNYRKRLEEIAAAR